MPDPEAPQLPKQVTRERLGDTHTWTFPQRDLGRLHWIGLGMMIGAMVMAALLAFLFRSRLFSGSLPPLLFAAVFFVILALEAGLGLVIWKGHARIVLGEGKLIAEDRFGFYRIRRRMRIDQIQEITAAYSPDGTITINNQPSNKFPKLANAGMLTAKMKAGKPKIVLVGYPREWVLAMGHTLSQQIGCPLTHESWNKEQLVDG